MVEHSVLLPCIAKLRGFGFGCIGVVAVGLDTFIFRFACIYVVIRIYRTLIHDITCITYMLLSLFYMIPLNTATITQTQYVQSLFYTPLKCVSRHNSFRLNFRLPSYESSPVGHSLRLSERWNTSRQFFGLADLYNRLISPFFFCLPLLQLVLHWFSSSAFVRTPCSTPNNSGTVCFL